MSAARPPKKPDIIATMRSCMSELLTCSASGRNDIVMSGWTADSAAATLLVNSAGEPPAARTLIEMLDGGSRRCAIGTYIVGGTGARSDRYTASWT